MYPERVRMAKLCNEEVDWVTVQAPEAGIVVAIATFLFILAPLATLCGHALTVVGMAIVVTLLIAGL